MICTSQWGKKCATSLQETLSQSASFQLKGKHSFRHSFTYQQKRTQTQIPVTLCNCTHKEQSHRFNCTTSYNPMLQILVHTYSQLFSTTSIHRYSSQHLVPVGTINLYVIPPDMGPKGITNSIQATSRWSITIGQCKSSDIQ